MAVSPDQEERRAIAKDPAKYNPRNPWPRVEQYAESLRNRPQIVLPTEEETQFANLPVEEYGNVKANRDRWAAAEELASALASRRESEQKEFQYSPGMPYPEYDTLQDKNFVEIARKKLDDANARVLEFSERLQNPKPLKDYPTLASALMQAPDLTEADVRRVVNFAAAWTASDAIMSAPDMQSQWNIFLSLPEIQQLVVWDIWQERVKEIQDEAEREQAEAEMAALRRREEASPLELAAMDLGGSALTFGSAALSALDVGYQTVQQYARAVATGTSRRRAAGEKAEISFLKAATIDPFFIWDEVAAGTWNNRTLEEARTEYGDALVDIVVEVQDLANEGDPSPISTLQAKYYSDPEKARILRLLTERQFKDSELLAEQQEILSAADKILSAQASDLGKIITTTNPLTGAPIGVDTWWRGSQPQKALSATTNVAATFMLDPFIIGGKVRGVYLGAKYGLERIAIDAGEKTVTAALSKPAVNAYLIDLTSDLKKYDDLVKAGKDTSQLGQVIANRYKNYFPEDVLFTMSKEGVHSPEALIKYVNDTNRMLAIERGQVIASDLTPDQKAKAIANIEDKSVFGRMARQQMAKRGQPLLPRNSILWTSHLRRQLSDALSVGARRKSAREEVRAFYKDANNPNLPAGAILFNDPTAVANFDEKITSGWDRLTRWAAQTTGRDVIYTADARDTQVFRRFARLFMSSNHADYLADRWRNGTQGDRILMWIGVVRAAAERRGASEIADKTRNLGTRVINNKSSLTVQEITDQLTFAKSPASLFAPESLAIGDTGRTVDDWIQSKVDEFIATQKINPVLSQQIDTIYSDIFDEANRIAAAEGKTLSQMSLGQGDDLAAKILDARAKVLLEDNPELLGKGIFESPTGLTIHNSSPAVRKAYMEKFYPNVKPDTKITIYRGVQEGEVPGVSLGTTGPAGGRVEPGGAAWWTTNPYVAQRLAETQGRKIATLTVSWDELQKIDPNFVPGPRAGGFGLDDEVMVDYTSDAFKSVQSRVSMSERIEGIPSAVAVQENALSGLQRIVSGEAEDSLNVNDLVTIRPSNVNGTEHALHLWQTADGVAIPHMKDIEDLKTYRNLGPEWLQTYGVNLPQNITDLWSLGTLYGFRFSQRSAIEDYWSYVVTSGRLDYLYKGRKAAMAFREARPNIKVVARDGKNDVVVDSRLGMFAKRFRKVGDKVKSKTDYGSPSLTSQILSVAFLENLDEAEVLAANIAFKNKDAEALKALHMKALGRYRLSGLNQQNMDDLVDLVDTSFGLKQLDEVAEQGAMINSGALPNPNLMVPGSDVPGVKTFSIPDDAKTVLGAFVDVPKGAKNYNLFWFNALHGITELDGPIGKIAISDILNKDRAIARIADTIRKDTKMGYKDRLSMIYTGEVSIDEFARRYYEDVRNMLSNKDGKLNMKLINTLAPVGDDGVRVVDIYKIGENGEKILKISPASMRQYADDAPEFVLGRNEIPMPQSEATLIDRGWNVLGEQYNRISKEPIALANYMEQRDILRPYQTQLAANVGDEAARKITARMAMDRAVGFTLSYTDNPANRSQLAWKVRNFSRYYRATEDFYRRAFRLAKNYPVAFWKTALTYQILEDTGMIFEDDNGNKYFAYPGTDLLNSATRTIFSWLFGDNIHLDLKPSFFGAQVNMLAPSSDINQLLPTPTGPIGVIPVKTLFSIFPEVQRFERYILGEYAAQGSWYDSLIPGQAARVLRAMSTDERYSMYGSATMDAVAIAVAEDLLPGDFQNIDQISKSDEIQGIRNIAMGTVITKLLLGFTVPASPQVYSETATDYARENGIESMRSAFLELVRAYDGDIQKAYRQWWRLNKDGDLMPFTVSRTEVSRDTVASFADVQPVFGLEDWYNDNKELYKKYPNASLLLTPKTGDFSFDSWNVLTRTLGIRVPKDVNTFMLDALSAKTQFQYMATLADYRKDIDALDPRIEDDRKRITQLESDRSDDINWLERQDPYWAQNRAENSNRAQAQNYAMTMYAEAKIMVNELKENGQASEVSSSIRSAIYTYEDYMTDIKMITGNTEAERDQKRQLRYEMERDLQEIAKRNENVKSFIENVLYWEPEFGER